jgi:hypothetical protein
MNSLPPLRLPHIDPPRTGDAAEDIRRVIDWMNTELPRAFNSWGAQSGLGDVPEDASSESNPADPGGGGGSANVEPGTVDGQLLRWNEDSQLWEPGPEGVLLSEDGEFTFVLPNGFHSIETQREGDTGFRFRINEIGAMQWGTGAGGSGALISKSGGNLLQLTGGWFIVGDAAGEHLARLRAHASQSAPIVLIEDNASSELVRVSPTGQLGLATGAPEASAQLQGNSTAQGWLFPRMTETERDNIASPVAGLVIYSTTTNKLNLYTGAVWEEITSA